MPSTRHILIALFITFITICGIANCFLRTRASASSPASTRIASHEAIGGRWQLVHASLGLDQLPASVAAPLPAVTPHVLPRVDFRKRKRAAPVQLHFAPDALRKSRLSLKELVVLFRRTTLEEIRADAARAETKNGRSRLGKLPNGKGHIPTSL